ncbi:hypothetical protein [Egicoccus halophilus]|uniref:Uncharacterized protein n=1 Tax=Egicoccus halophilus TaxID=1670830 RepID=A0A8J3AAY3_9ACTN|nr:hypothetical protein [Egicoccus halophilus]GGI03588.1 hypothetical protein GCM10011354_04780 [Egicoccus halophilus]
MRSDFRLVRLIATALATTGLLLGGCTSDDTGVSDRVRDGAPVAQDPADDDPADREPADDDPADDDPADAASAGDGPGESVPGAGDVPGDAEDGTTDAAGQPAAGRDAEDAAAADDTGANGAADRGVDEGTGGAGRGESTSGAARPRPTEPPAFREGGVLEEAFGADNPFPADVELDCVTQQDLDVVAQVLGEEAVAEFEDLIAQGYLERC